MRAGATAFLGLAMSVVGLVPAAPSMALPLGEKGPAALKVSAHTADYNSILGGTFTVADVDLNPAGDLVATGSLIGTVTRPGALHSEVDEHLTLPVDLGQSTATCRALNLAIGPGDLIVAGEPMHMEQTPLNISMQQGPGSRLVIPLCAAGNLIKGNRPTASPELRDVLDQILTLLPQG